MSANFSPRPDARPEAASPTRAPALDARALDASLDSVGTARAESPSTVRLQMPGTLDALPAIREAVVEAAAACGLGVEDIFKIEMAVDEACTNVIEHAYQTQPLQREIEVLVQALADRLEITILDYSTINFPIDEATGISADEYLAAERKRGLGLYIIRSFVDAVEHRFVTGRGNELKLTKYFA